MNLKCRFSKYSGCGNDFIAIDNRQLKLALSREQIKRLCHRQQGIGADGILLLEESVSLDFKMAIFNADGSEAEMCGNGLRCLAQFIHKLGHEKRPYRIETLAGEQKIDWRGLLVAIEMELPQNIRDELPLSVGERELTVAAMEAGVPHAVCFVGELKKFPLAELGPLVRNHPLFAPEGTNFSCACLNGKELHLRTYERGVEEETLACGTGAVATAVAAARKYRLPSPVTVIPASGEPLQVFLDGKKATLVGGAEEIYSGEILVEP